MKPTSVFVDYQVVSVSLHLIGVCLFNNGTHCEAVADGVFIKVQSSSIIFTLTYPIFIQREFVHENRMRKEKATLFLLAFVATVAADGYDNYGGGYGNYGGGDDTDDFYQQQDDQYSDAGEVQYYDDDSFIQYWTEYAIEPRRCINYQGVDVIVFSMYEQKYQMCSDKPMGTYVTPVPTFVDAWLAQQAQQAQDNGIDYEAPDAASYVQCTVTEVENQMMYLQVGCSDVTSKSIAINIYSDATCETLSKVDGYDDANVDITEIQPPFKSCLPCVVWYDTDDQGVDDQFYEKRQTNPPLCKNVWDYRSDCNKKCQKIGVEKENEGSVWNTSDKVLLVILSLFGMKLITFPCLIVRISTFSLTILSYSQKPLECSSKYLQNDVPCQIKICS